MAAYLKRKKIFQERIQKMIGYVEGKDCRSKDIGLYFGDTELGDCGMCDNCLAKKRKDPETTEFSVIHDRLLKLLSGGPVPANRLFGLMEPLKKESVTKALRFLQEENKIWMNDLGEVLIK